MILCLIQLLSHWTPWDDLDMKTCITSCLILEPWKHQSVITKIIKKNIYKFRRLESVLFVWMILDVVRISVTYHHLKQDKKSKISINLEAAEGHGFYWLLWLMNTQSISFKIMFSSTDKLTLSFFFASGFYRTPAKWS